jgi:hypothetical protein
MTAILCGRARLWLAAAIVGFTHTAARAAVEVIGVQYQQDQTFPEYKCFWHDDCHLDVPGAYLHVFLKNTGDTAATITDMTLAGYPLTTVIKQDPAVDGASSIFFYWDNPPNDLLNAGSPVWFKGDPKVIPAGGVAQGLVRLRLAPTTPTVAVGVVTTAGTVTTNLAVSTNGPVLASVGFSPDRTKVYLHWRQPGGSGSAVPETVRMDGDDVTAITTTSGDPALNFGVSVIRLAEPLPYMSYHVFQGVFAGGATATGALRAWSHPFLYASWGTFPYADDSTSGAQAWITEATQHGFNAAQNQGFNGALGDYLNTAAGKAYADARGGYGLIIWRTGAANEPLMSFLEDEPDAQEARLEQDYCGSGLALPCGMSPIGVLALREIAEGETYRSLYPLTPTTLNVDGSFRPINYIGWAQAVDVIQADPYYQMRLVDAYVKKSVPISLYLKATYIYAVTRALVTGAEPNPAHPILFSCQLFASDGGLVWPFPTREAKRIEVYYALAAGAKGLSYWWFTPGPKFDGLGRQSVPEAQALWKELGLLGNEIKTVGPLLVVSHPVDLPLTPSSNVWSRALAAGEDTLLLFAVNDNYYNDTNGFHSTPVANATITATLPAWLLAGPVAPMVFEVATGGLKAANTQLNGNQLQINLGSLPLTRLVVITKNPQVPLLTQQRYSQQAQPGLCAFAPEFCTNSAPAIVVPPQSQTVVLGDPAVFTVAASGYPLPTYQWRFNGTNLAGATGDSFTRTNAQAAHSGGYSVVVSNSLGSVTSIVATLTVNTNGIAPTISIPPQSQTVQQGQSATFTVTASGTSPLTYQWRFNDADLAGANGSSYTRFNAQTADAGEYRVVVTNAAGAVTSAPATLTVTVPIYCLPVGLVNGDFEGATNGGVGAGWTAYEVNSPSIKVWSIQTASPAEGSQYQQIQAYNAAYTASAGVRQNVTGCVPGATYQISGWYRSNSDNGRARVRVSPSASTNWNTAVDLNPPADYGSGTTWATFSGTVVATGTNMTLWLDGRTISGTSAKVGCFDAVTVTCLGPMAAPVLEANRVGGNLVFRWPTNYGNYTLIATTNLASPWSAIAPPPTVVNGTNVVTNAVSGERKFYRLMRP